MSGDEFEGDLAGAVFWGADLRGATFRDVDLTGARISHAFVLDVAIDGHVDRLVVNGVDVTAYVHERDPLEPMRAALRATDPDALRAGWPAIEAAWTAAADRARALGGDAAKVSVGGEFSFVETARHVTFAIDKWFTVPLAGGTFDPTGLPNRGSMDFPWPELRYELAPGLDDALAAVSDRFRSFASWLAGVSRADLAREVEVLENGTSSVLDCVHTVLEEVFWHTRYAERDLESLEAGAAG